ncbi:hypothetical protein QR721_07745 [Aciduricibacillus chroicocephali]|uniref:Uncharacterized protein n=1 Tax=Aciduricibacillus chroicocephali TaxID=3054939 RepID=A0ABY9KRY9_9BACI|nr:hypothetical protein QR721_07745 [Bacillaceae bacterium 44XB]
MDTNEMFKLAGEKLMLRLENGKPKKQRKKEIRNRGTLLFGDLPLLLKCAMKKKDGRAG